VVDGTGDWPAAVVSAIRDGAAGVIVVRPAPADMTELRSVAAERGVVVLDSIWASNPVVQAAAAALRPAIGPRSRLECRIVVGVRTDLDRALLDQLSLVRGLVAPVSELEMLKRSHHGYVGEARAGGAAVDLSVVCSNAVHEHAKVRLITSDGSVEVEIPEGETAKPAYLTITTSKGTELFPTQYESGHRATWRRLHRLLTTGQQSTELDGLEDDIATAGQSRQHKS
jgi:hypothetical protein